MRKEHRNIQLWIKKHYGHKYKVAAEIDKQNYLPDQKLHWYQPDVILSDRQGQIKYIIEVENDPVRKALVGASILADYSIAKLGQQTKPRLIFIVYTKQGIRQIPNFIEKLNIAMRYITHLKKIEIYSTAHFKKLKL
jgi:hypothetical protein